MLVVPAEARVYVDGYYAGAVDDFDGLFQRLQVAPGRHEISFKLEGYKTHRVRVYMGPDATLKLYHDMEKGQVETFEDLTGGAPLPEREVRGDRMERLACLLTRFGNQLQSDRRLKEAEFVQKLALALAPDCYFTNLPLAITYHETGRCTEARPLFERGFAQLHVAGEKESAPARFTLADCFGDGVEATRLRALWLEMYDQCVKSAT